MPRYKPWRAPSSPAVTPSSATSPHVWGPEEFAVLLSETDARGALAVAERIRQRVIEMNIEHDAGASHPHLSVSPSGSRRPSTIRHRKRSMRWRSARCGALCAKAADAIASGPRRRPKRRPACPLRRVIPAAASAKWPVTMRGSGAQTGNRYHDDLALFVSSIPSPHAAAMQRRDARRLDPPGLSARSGLRPRWARTARGARLRRIRWIHDDHLASSVLCFLADQRGQYPKPGVEQLAIKPALGLHIPARLLDGTSCRPGHVRQPQILKHDPIIAIDDRARDLMQVVAARVRLALLRSRQTACCGDAGWIATVQAPTDGVFHRRPHRAPERAAPPTACVVSPDAHSRSDRHPRLPPERECPDRFPPPHPRVEPARSHGGTRRSRTNARSWS